MNYDLLLSWKAQMLRQLDALEKLLKELGPPELEMPSAARKPAVDPALNGKPKTKPKAKPKRKAKARRTSLADMLSAVAGLVEPFGAADMAERLDITGKNAANILGKMHRKGLLDKVSYGQWKRSAKFSMAGVKPSNKELEYRALKESMDAMKPVPTE